MSSSETRQLSLTGVTHRDIDRPGQVIAIYQQLSLWTVTILSNRLRLAENFTSRCPEAVFGP